MTDKKKPWTEPELIVIVRSREEESVLGSCKATPREGPNLSASACTGLGGDCLSNIAS